MSSAFRRSKANTRRTIPWIILESSGTVLISFLSLLVFARFLSPRDVGIASIALSVAATVEVTLLAPFAEALIRRKQLPLALLDTYFTYSVAAGCVIAIGLTTCSGWLATVYGEPDLRAVTILAGMTVVVNAIGSLPNTILMKKMRGRSLAVRTLLARTAGLVTTTAIALFMASAAAILWGNLLTSVISSAFAWSLYRRHPRIKWSPQLARETASYGFPVLIESLLWSVASRVFLALVGLFSGATVLGLFTMAFRLYETLTGLVNQASQRLLFPVFAQLQEERRQLQQAFLLASRALAAVSTPLFLFVAVAAEDITRALLSEKWTAAIPAIRVLSVAGAISASAATIGPMVKVVSTPKWLIANAATAAICSIAAIAATGTADAAITALAWSSRLLGTYPLVLVQLGLVVGFSVWSFLRASALPTLRSGAIWCLVAAVLQVLPVEAGFARLAFIAVVGGSMELLALWMLDRSFVMRLIELLRSSRTRR